MKLLTGQPYGCHRARKFPKFISWVLITQHSYGHTAKRELARGREAVSGERTEIAAVIREGRYESAVPSVASDA